MAWKRKINLKEQLEGFYGQHRSGWLNAIKCLEPLDDPHGVYFDCFIERTFCWHPKGVHPHQQPWIGFIHVPPNVPRWFQYKQSNDYIFETQAWEKSYPFCQGLYTLSYYHRRNLEAKLCIPINNLIFPTETPELKWSWDRFQANPDKKIIQVGWWLRKLHTIYQLPTHTYRKIFLKITHADIVTLMQREREHLINERKFQDAMYESAETVTFISNDQYDRWLANNLVIVNLYDASGNNTVIECIARNTPLLINPLEAVVEYLGNDYPLYFSSLEEAAEKAENLDLIYSTYQYLLNHPLKEKLKGEYFLQSFANSSIYEQL